jgi:hypothetical protein
MPNFSATGVTLTNPVWLASMSGHDIDRILLRAPVMLDAAQWSAQDSVLVTVNDASIAAGDTAVTVTALPGPLPAGAYLDFSGGTNAQVARTSIAHAAGATTLTVYPLDGTIANGSTATWAGTKIKSVPSGTLVGRTLAEQAASSAWGPAATGDIPPLGEIGFTYHDCPNLDVDARVTLVMPGATIKYNKLPFAYASLAAGLLTYLRTYYRMILGAA